MIFADKIIQLRKKNGWSQEELANEMNVTRQSVSKWEGAQSVPDLNKILKLSELFGVSVDYLLKDEMEEMEQEGIVGEQSNVRRVSMEEASAFLTVKEQTSGTIAIATLLCILSPVCLIVMGGLSEIPGIGISEDAAGAIGMIALLTIIAIAVAIFITSGNKTAPFSYLEKEVFETEYGVSGMVKERREQYRNTYNKGNVLGAGICILALIPLFAAIALGQEQDMTLLTMTCVMLTLIGIGVTFFIRCGIVWESFDKLLQEGDYSRKKKEGRSIMTAIGTAYWLIATAVYLGYSLTTNDWHVSWIVWVVAGVLFPAVVAIVRLLEHKE